MPILTESEVRARAQKSISNDRAKRGAFTIRKSEEILREAAILASAQTGFDMFLSHSIKDAELVLGVKGVLEDLGYKPYVDWIDDPSLDRSNVTPQTADVLRQRMRTSASLFYLTTSNADQSKWMPWECGYYDGYRAKVAILPIRSYVTSEFKGVEYLGLYPYCIKGQDTLGKERLWIHRSSKSYTNYDHWVATPNENVGWKE